MQLFSNITIATWENAEDVAGNSHDEKKMISVYILHVGYYFVFEATELDTTESFPT